VRNTAQDCQSGRKSCGRGQGDDGTGSGPVNGNLHIGLTPWLAPLNMDAHVLASQAERAEALGFDSFWLPENHLQADSSDNTMAIPEPMLLLAAVASRTTRLKLGTVSFLLPVRHPLQAAEQVATLDVLTRGRLILGIGRGFSRPLFRIYGMDPRHKRALFAEHLQFMRKAWRGESLTMDRGDTFRLSPLPVQRPHPPLWSAAFGDKALQQAGLLQLPYLAAPITSFSRLRRNLEQHRAAALQAGVKAPDAIPVMRTLFISHKRSEQWQVRDMLCRQTRRLMRSRMPWNKDMEAVDSWALVGEPAEVAEKVSLYREQLGMTHLVVTRPTRFESDRIEPRLLENSLMHLAQLAERWRTTAPAAVDT